MGMGKTVLGMKVPWSKPDIGVEERDAVLRVLESGWVSQGPVTEQFEVSLAEYAQIPYAVYVNNGTSALIAAYMAEGIGKNDYIVIPDYTHIATANAAKILGAKIVLVDVDSETWNMNLDLLEKACRKYHPRFVVSVDVAGLPNDYQRLRELADEYDFTLIIDGAESFGAEYKGRKVHSLETAIASFHTAKQLTTIEGGAVFTNSETIRDSVKAIRNHGGAQCDYWSKGVGFNFRPDDVHAAIGLVQLAKLDKAIEHRNWAVNEYKKSLPSLQFQETPKYVTRHGYMMCLTSTPIPFTLSRHLTGEDVETRRPWPPINQQLEFSKYKCVRANILKPVSAELYARTLALPLYNTITKQEIDAVTSAILH